MKSTLKFESLWMLTVRKVVCVVFLALMLFLINLCQVACQCLTTYFGKEKPKLYNVYYTFIQVQGYICNVKV